MLDILVLWGGKVAALLGVVIPFVPRKVITARLAPPKTPIVEARPSARNAGPQGPIRVSAKPLTPAQHFDRVGAVITRAIRSSQLASEMHETARQQLEVVEFSIDRILDDVAEVMALAPELLAMRKPVAALVPLHRRAA